MSHSASHPFELLQRTERPLEVRGTVATDFHAFGSEAEGLESLDVEIALGQYTLLDQFDDVWLFVSVDCL